MFGSGQGMNVHEIGGGVMLPLVLLSAGFCYFYVTFRFYRNVVKSRTKIAFDTASFILRSGLYSILQLLPL